MASPPARFLHGLSTARKDTPFGNFIEPNPGACHKYFNDFDTYLAGDWTVTTTTGSNALASLNGGAIAQTTAASNNDIQHNLKTTAHFAFTSGNQFWFSARVLLTDSTSSEALIGVQAGGTAFAPTDGVYFNKATAGQVWTLKITASSSTTTLTFPTTANAADSTYQTLSFYYDGRTVPTLYAWVATDSAPDENSENSGIKGIVSTQTMTNLPSAVCSVGFGVKAGAAAAKTMRTDFIFAANEITR